MLPDQGHRTPQGAVKDEYGTMAELLLEVQNRWNSTKKLIWCYFDHKISHADPQGACISEGSNNNYSC
jgi:hypothetical protein